MQVETTYWLQQAESWGGALPSAETLAAFQNALEEARISDPPSVLDLVFAAASALAPQPAYHPQVTAWLALAGEVLASHGDEGKLTWGTAGLFRALGDLCLSVEAHAMAHGFYYVALERYGKREESLAGQAHTLKGLGDLALAQGQRDSAYQHYYRALVLYEVVGFKLGQANMWRQIAPLKPNEARQAYGRAIALYQDMHFELEQAKTYALLGQAHLKAGDPAAAHDAYQKAQALFAQIGFEDEVARLYLELGTTCALQGQWEAARDAFQNAHEQLGAAAAETPALISLAECYEQLDDFPRARALYEQADQEHDAAHVDELALDAQLALIALDLKDGQPAEAVRRLWRVVLQDFWARPAFHSQQEALGERLNALFAPLGQDFIGWWQTITANAPLPAWAGGRQVVSTQIQRAEIAKLTMALRAPQALAEALHNDPHLLASLAFFQVADRQLWLEEALKLLAQLDPSPTLCLHEAQMLKELAPLHQNEVSPTLHRALAAYERAIDLADDDRHLRYQAHRARVALLRDMAGMGGENRRALLYQALDGCDAGLAGLQNGADYGELQLIRAHVLRELAGLRGEARPVRMQQALDAIDAVLASDSDEDTPPSRRAITHTTRASLLQEMASLSKDREKDRLKDALNAALAAWTLAQQEGDNEYARAAGRMLVNVRQTILTRYGDDTFTLWWGDMVGQAQPDWAAL